MTAKTQKRDIISGLEAGADDYLTKPYDPLELRARVLAGRRVLELQEELIAAREAMRHQATRDFLTGAWNHRAIMEILDREMNRARREAKPLGIMMADLDHFKRVNDVHGHLGGDAVLREASGRMASTVRPYDQIGRYGGEEFLIVLPGCDVESLLKLGERIRERIAGALMLYSEQAIAVTTSIGAAVFVPPNPIESVAFLQKADEALYRAKNGGRNRVVLDGPPDC